MELTKLNLRPQEQRILEGMSLNTVEKLVLKWGEELTLGKQRGNAIVTRAKNVIARERIMNIKCDDDSITVTLSDTSDPTMACVRHVLGFWDYLEEDVEGDTLIIYAPDPKPCYVCGTKPLYICLTCEAWLCQECRSKHEHGYYELKEIRSLEEMFARVRQRAAEYSPMPPEKREVETKPSEEVISVGQQLGFDGLAESFFSELEGSELMKKAITCALLSTPAEPVHVLVVGDPAGGKTLARDIMARTLGSDIELIGANTTRSGLVCNLATGDPGVLAYANEKVVLADEFDKIPDQDVEYCYELLSNGKCSIHGARVHETIESHFVMIAFANPVETVFVREPIEEIGLPPILISRFALIVKVEELEPERRMDILKRKLVGGKTPDSARSHLSWLRESRKHRPKLSVSDTEIDAYTMRVDRLIQHYLKTPLRRDLRMGDYGRRVPFSIARASFSDVDGKILDQAANLMEACLAAWQR